MSGKVTALAAASGTQIASWDEEARHGLFTHHLLDALYGKGDADGDGKVTRGEALAYCGPLHDAGGVPSAPSGSAREPDRAGRQEFCRPSLRRVSAARPAPDGKDDAAFERAKALDTVESYAAYLSRCGRHRQEASSLKAAACGAAGSGVAGSGGPRSGSAGIGVAGFRPGSCGRCVRSEDGGRGPVVAGCEGLRCDGSPDAGSGVCAGCVGQGGEGGGWGLPGGPVLRGAPGSGAARYSATVGNVRRWWWCLRVRSRWALRLSEDGFGHDTEGPRHRVRIFEPFAVGKYEVTFAASMGRFMSASGTAPSSECQIIEYAESIVRSDYGWGNPRLFADGSGDPVACVNWKDARSYVSMAESGRRGRGIVCCRSRSGSTRRARGRRDRFILGGRFRRTRRTTMADTSMVRAGRGYGGRRRCLWEASFQTVSVCTTCTGTFGSGLRIAGMGATRVRLGTGGRGRAAIANGALCAADPGTTLQGTIAPRSAYGTRTITPTTSSASASPGRSHLESLPLYLRESRGRSPLARIFRCPTAGSVARRVRSAPGAELQATGENHERRHLDRSAQSRPGWQAVSADRAATGATIFAPPPEWIRVNPGVNPSQ